MAETIPTIPPTSPKSVKRQTLEWGLKGLAATLPALIAGWVAVSQAKYESATEVARINAKASAGYEALLETAEDLEESNQRLAALVQMLEKRVERLEDKVNMEAVPPRFDGSDELDAMVKSKRRKRRPRTLDEAAEAAAQRAK